MADFQWTCPVCGKAQIIGEESHHAGQQVLHIGSTAHRTLALKYQAIRCLNKDCNQPTVVVVLSHGAITNQGIFNRSGDLVSTRLIPRSEAKPQPLYIPEVLRADYLEACLIRDDSPKASATLARRALQGMLRDFCGVNEKTLFAEITKLEQMLADGTAPKGVEEETIAAIHAVRKIGNIGAHMEGDINVIVDVDPGEAQALIDLIEMLFDEWYVARNTRQQRLAKILEIDGAKQAIKAEAAAQKPALAPE